MKEPPNSITTTTNLIFVNESILTVKDVAEMTTLSKSTIYRMIRSNEFPRCIYVSKNRSGFLASEINDWIRHRPRVAD